MSASEGISRSGREAERLYCEYTGADLCAAAALGDVVLDGHYVEIKKASSGTINQVRTVKYIPLVVYVPPDGWLVVPAVELVRLISERTPRTRGGRLRGQHTENPFECATFSPRDLVAWKVEPGQLRAATLHAIEQSEARPDVKAAMDWVQSECVGLAARSLEAVRRLF